MPAQAFTRCANSLPLQPEIVFTRKAIVLRERNFIETFSGSQAMCRALKTAKEKAPKQPFVSHSVRHCATSTLELLSCSPGCACHSNGRFREPWLPCV